VVPPLQKPGHYAGLLFLVGSTPADRRKGTTRAGRVNRARDYRGRLAHDSDSSYRHAPDRAVTNAVRQRTESDPKRNRKLSLRRAITVRDYLIGQGIAASATDFEGLGSSVPISDNATAEGRARNRRVEIVVSGPPL